MGVTVPEHGSNATNWILKWIALLSVAAWAINLAYDVLLKAWPVVVIGAVLWLVGAWLLGRNSGGYR